MFDGLILAGASSRRFGGSDKALVELSGRSFLQRSLDALSEARRIVVAGPARDGFSPSTWVDDGSNGGPVAALAAGMRAVQSEVVVVLAVDMPLVTREHVCELVRGLLASDTQAVVLVDPSEHVNYLAGAYLREPLTQRLEALPHADGAKLRDLMAGLRVSTLESEAARDCDSPQELRRLEAELGV